MCELKYFYITVPMSYNFFYVSCNNELLFKKNCVPVRGGEAPRRCVPVNDDRSAKPSFVCVTTQTWTLRPYSASLPHYRVPLNPETTRFSDIVETGRLCFKSSLFQSSLHDHVYLIGDRPWSDRYTIRAEDNGIINYLRWGQ